MAFQVKELMVALNPYGQTQTTTKPPCSCVYPSSPMVACGKTEGQCPTASATVPFPASDSRRDLELLRRNLAQRSTN